MRAHKNLALILSLTTLSATAAVEQLPVGEYSRQTLAQWEEHSFKGNTRYQLTRLEGKSVVKAESEAAASGLFRKIRVDLEKTPYLRWQWRVENTITSAYEQQKSGDDYPARIYVVKEGGLLPWNTMAVNYVWSSNQPAGSSWHNAYSSRARMIALQSGNSKSGQWVEERRNVRDDFRKLFGEDVRHIDVVALMTDTDNTGEKVVAYYGDILFSSD